MQKTKFFSWKCGDLCKGCEQCVKGQKSVLFVTGLCSENCWYCSLSDAKKNKDLMWINERPFKKDEDLIEEIKLCDSRGCSFTGGDPLLVLERTLKYIKLLKKEFGERFHIHLYTPLKLVDEDKLKRLYEAGLDEIRFHPKLDESFDKILLGKKFSWKVGVEIPAIPGKEKETRELIEFLVQNKIDFLNINELEFSDSNCNKISEKGFEPKSELSYGVKGSEDMALRLLKDCSMNIHYCTSTLKDKVQLANRIKRRARNIKKDYDKITSEGMLVRGAIYLEKPGFNYRLELEKKNKEEEILRLKEIRKELINKFSVSSKYIDVDELKLRLLTSSGVIKKLKGKVSYILAMVEEYPTWDQFEVEIEFVE